MDNQKSYIKAQTTQWPKDKEQNDIQNITQKTKDRATPCVDTDHPEG